MKNNILIDRLSESHILTHEEYVQLLSSWNEEDRAYAREKAESYSDLSFHHQVYVRGIVEFSNYCRNDCLYCGIRRSNKDLERYRLDEETILSCCEAGHGIGYRTFVLQGGEDMGYSDRLMAHTIHAIKERFPDSAITLSLGERPPESYLLFKEAGADRYLLRHESADSAHFAKLHPASQVLSTRMACLHTLKRLGFQTGAGMMVGSPYQSADNLATDMEFLQSFRPEMVGMGPFIPHHCTPLRDFPAGSVPLTLFLLSLVRLMLPSAMIPATTALGTVEADGRLKGIQAGANVIMMNLSPFSTRKDYLLYDQKRETNDRRLTSVQELDDKLRTIGYRALSARGDYHA
jgi:biotin synthase